MGVIHLFINFWRFRWHTSIRLPLMLSSHNTIIHETSLCTYTDPAVLNKETKAQA